MKGFRMYSKFDASRVNWDYALPRLGLEAHYLQNPGKQKPCPFHPQNGKTKFRFLKPYDRGMWVCNDCGIGDAVSLLQKLHGWSFKDVMRALEDASIVNAPPPVARLNSPEEAAKKAELIKRGFVKMRRWWRSSKHIAAGDSPARRYLENRIAQLDVATLGNDLRAHPGLSFYDVDDGGKSKCLGQFPALIGLFRNVDGDVKMMHRIYLTPAGKKAPLEIPKKMFAPEWVSGCAVRIGIQSEDDHVIGVAEGIEKSAAIFRACKEKFPIYCAGTAHGVETLQVPLNVLKVHIFADNDLPSKSHPKGRSQTAALILKQRLEEEGRVVVIHVAKTPNGDHEDDWNAMVVEAIAA
jgi:putative DNA primase/helicase